MDQENETTFWELINRHRIEIPIIQRDYAQGRDNAKAADIRRGFVARLKGALTGEGKEALHLNFVYGKLKGVKHASKQASGQQAVKAMLSAAKAYSHDLGLKLDFTIEPSSSNSNGQNAISFVPLDGQQRLTTLYLLHWYLLQRLKKTDELSKLKNFTYRVRPSSKDFCASLSEKTVEIGKGDIPSRQIKDAPWYFSYWSKDPTVSGMLRMLDEIHEQFKNEEPAQIESAWESLTTGSKVTFSFPDLKEHQLTDDLYIRMNARGKPLTEFEKFKAWLIDYVHQAHQEKITIEPENWKVRLDTIWTDLFWANKAENDYTVDRAYLNFFRNMAQIFLVREDSFKPDGTSDDARENRRKASMLATNKRQDEYVYVPNSFYRELEVFTEENLKELFTILDQLTKEVSGQEPMENWIANIDFLYDEKHKPTSLFKRFIGGGMSYPDKVHFYGLMRYLLACKEKNIDPQESSLFSWMRVVRNLVENSQIDSIETFTRAIKGIGQIGADCLNIYEYLEDGQNKFIGFAEIQVAEEREKAILIRDNAEWERTFLKVENHKYFRGQINFLLELASVEGEKTINGKAFDDYARKCAAIFDYKLADRDDVTFERALLSQGDYLIEIYSKHSFVRMFTPSGKTIQDWRRTIFRTPEKLKTIMKQLLDKLTVGQEISEMEDLSKNSLINDWRKYFIEFPEVIQFCNQRLIKQYDKDNIRILGESGMNHYHAELRSYWLYITLKRQNNISIDIDPFKNIDYYQVRSMSEFPCAFIDNWKQNGRHYAIDFRYAWQEKFELRFFNRENSGIEPSVKECLIDMNMIISEKYSDESYLIKKDEKELLTFLQELCANLNILSS
ncbi:MAG: DUF262 domain-containing protein [Phaeodactylibacter sp.]|nr:DUF262 domain-containing protein [Phaeodactylibacter sp.]